MPAARLPRRSAPSAHVGRRGGSRVASGHRPGGYGDLLVVAPKLRRAFVRVTPAGADQLRRSLAYRAQHSKVCDTKARRICSITRCVITSISVIFILKAAMCLYGFCSSTYSLSQVRPSFPSFFRSPEKVLQERAKLGPKL